MEGGRNQRRRQRDQTDAIAESESTPILGTSKIGKPGGTARGKEKNIHGKKDRSKRRIYGGNKMVTTGIGRQRDRKEKKNSQISTEDRNANYKKTNKKEKKNKKKKQPRNNTTTQRNKKNAHTHQTNCANPNNNKKTKNDIKISLQVEQRHSTMAGTRCASNRINKQNSSP